MGVDESFRQPGSVPFKWEIRPGVPKVQQPPCAGIGISNHHHKRPSTTPQPPPKLRPPPSSPRYDFSPPPAPDFRTGSFRSAPRSRSDRWIFDRPEVVSVGCFRAPLMGRTRNDGKKRIVKKLPEPMFNYDVELLTRRSFSIRRNRSPFLASPVSSYSSSYESSPRPIKDSDWAGFGLF